jgi:hypothetical protein
LSGEQQSLPAAVAATADVQQQQPQRQQGELEEGRAAKRLAVESPACC